MATARKAKPKTAGDILGSKKTTSKVVKQSLAGDRPTYRFALVREHFTDTNGQVAWIATEFGFDYVRVTHFLKEVLGIPPGAMAWWGFRLAEAEIVKALADDPVPLIDAKSMEELEVILRERGVDPISARDEASDRGTAAHHVLECLVPGSEHYDPERAAGQAQQELEVDGTGYGNSVIRWWNEQVQPYLDDGTILEIVSERTLWSHKLQVCGTTDLAILWEHESGEGAYGWEIIDLKTHKPAPGFTKTGCAYDTDVAQVRTYRMCHEEMGLGLTFRNRILVAREREYNGVCYLEDYREVPEEFVVLTRKLYDLRMAFNAKEEVPA